MTGLERIVEDLARTYREQGKEAAAAEFKRVCANFKAWEARAVREALQTAIAERGTNSG